MRDSKSSKQHMTEIMSAIDTEMKWKNKTFEEFIIDSKTPYEFVLHYYRDTWDPALHTNFSRWASQTDVHTAKEALKRFARYVATNRDIALFFWLVKRKIECTAEKYVNLHCDNIYLGISLEIAPYSWRYIPENEEIIDLPQPQDFWLNEHWIEYRNNCLKIAANNDDELFNEFDNEQDIFTICTQDQIKNRQKRDYKSLKEQEKSALQMKLNLAKIKRRCYYAVKYRFNYREFIQKNYEPELDVCTNAVKDRVLQYCYDFFYKMVTGRFRHQIPYSPMEYIQDFSKVTDEMFSAAVTAWDREISSGIKRNTLVL